VALADNPLQGAVLDQDGCLIWQRAKCPDGYGRVKQGGVSRLVHVVVYEQANGPVPEGMEIDHTCRKRLCINIEHLEAVTHLVNTLRGVGPTAKNARKTHCPRGHSLSGSNLYRHPSGRRRCRTCTTEHQRARVKRAMA
jgi:hypothetical protein